MLDESDEQAVPLQQMDEFIEESDDVLTGGDARDGASQDVVEHQGGDAELGKRASKRLFHDAIDATPREHAAALDVHGTDGEAEQHDAEDEPGSGLSDSFLSDASGVEGGGAEIVEHDGSCAPERDEGEHDGRRNDEANTCRSDCLGTF